MRVINEKRNNKSRFTPEGRKFGFTSDKYLIFSYLWKSKDYIIISMIDTKEHDKGYFSKLLKNIWKAGYKIKVPMPFVKMKFILNKKGFIKHIEYNEIYEENIEVWIK